MQSASPPASASLRIWSVPIFQDNYVWVLEREGKAWVVDPGDAGPVIDALSARSLSLEGILLTHHHWDHIDGVPDLRHHAPSLRLVGPFSEAERERIPTPDLAVIEGDEVELLGLRLAVMEVPGHTLGHVAYAYQGEAPFALVGDTLFLGGCGRLFEGTPEQMAGSLRRLMSLVPETFIYCTHEYARSNYQFCAKQFPDDQAISARLASLEVPSVPSRLDEEMKANPFLRVLAEEPSLLAALDAKTGDEAFRELRTRRNDW